MSYEWSPAIEQLVKKIGEQSLCYNILHRRSQSYYAYYNHFIAIPVIVLSSLTGAATFALSGQEGELPSILLGSLSILAGFIQTLGSYFRFAQLSETHRMVGLQYNKMYQTITTQLALAREIRDPAAKVLDLLKDTIERLQEVAPEVPEYVINGFKRDYKDYTDVKRPEITNGLEAILINVEPPPPRRASVISVRLPPPEPVPEPTPAPPPTSPPPTLIPKPWK